MGWGGKKVHEEYVGCGIKKRGVEATGRERERERQEKKKCINIHGRHTPTLKNRPTYYATMARAGKKRGGIKKGDSSSSDG